MPNGVLADEAALLCDVGRRGVRVALTDAAGALRPDTIRSYDASVTTTISGTLSAFRRDSGLAVLPRRCAMAVAGLVRGDTISVTNSRWFISRSGLRSMLQHPPIILNDYAAQAWAVGCAGRTVFEPASTGTPPPIERPGTYLVLGMTTGLGVAVLTRDERQRTAVVATEAGHGVYVRPDGEAGVQLAELLGGQPLVAEDVVSGPGLLRIYQALTRRSGAVASASTPEEVTRIARSEAHAGRACELVAHAFWAFAGNAVLSFAAWDGVVVTGKLAQAIRPVLRQPGALEQFVRPGSHVRLLRETPRAFAAVDHPELAGAACALREAGGAPAPALAA